MKGGLSSSKTAPCPLQDYIEQDKMKNWFRSEELGERKRADIRSLINDLSRCARLDGLQLQNPYGESILRLRFMSCSIAAAD